MNITMNDRQRAVAFARAQVGDNYKWLGSGPNDWDCSGLVQAVLAKLGVHVDHNSGAQARELHAVPFTTHSRRALRLGDPVFWYGDVKHPDSITHCGIFSGWNQYQGHRRRFVIAAVDVQYGVKEHMISWALRPSGVAHLAAL